MRALDRELQRQRCKRAANVIHPGASILDLGTANGRLFTIVKGHNSQSLGIDKDNSLPWLALPTRRIVGDFLQIEIEPKRFDVVTLLAVCEHLSLEELMAWVVKIKSLLNLNGQVLLTIPSAKVDGILHWAIKLRILDGMEAHAHHGAQANDVVNCFLRQGFELIKHEQFQFGLNNLIVLKLPATQVGTES